MRLPSCSCTTRSQGWGMTTSNRIKLCRVACICSPAGHKRPHRVHTTAAGPEPTSPLMQTHCRCSAAAPCFACTSAAAPVTWPAPASIHAAVAGKLAKFSLPKEKASEVAPRSGLPPRHSLPVCGCQHRCSHPDLDCVRSRRDTVCFADWTTYTACESTELPGNHEAPARA